MSPILSHFENPYSYWLYSKSRYQSSLKIVPERGGLITSWELKDQEILYFDQKRFHQKDKSIRGGIPILFPICGDLPNGYFNFQDEKYLLRQHGFARDFPWQVSLTQKEKNLKLSFGYNQKTLKMYPFKFLINIEICLLENSLLFTINIKNCDHKLMPFSFGLHPYFKVTDLSKVYLQGLSEKCIDHHNMSSSHTNLQLKKLDNGVDFQSNSNGMFSLIDPLARKRLDLIHDNNLNTAVIWTDPPRQMICLEPWTSPRNALITKEKIIYLKPMEIKELKLQLLKRNISKI